ncbi:hypothetical protein KZX46_00295 (plasmid) [Polymorphobacter sp. PAMC 29334]|uniref:ligand-binding sensor domain-containing protein n=1 Tax=Polymorphobacter sp. PAMC 29334 TaxID=2862331 RepID=UPI001C795532|nr:sensor histidine kinase [Polymorphobacter sp. PAMC 29334]QYE33291.1 hypothetical protein KZX46_00295 [Polymorphobacter sp. PAMC 29334]
MLLIMVWLIAQPAGSVDAQQPATALGIKQYTHKRWTVEDGVPNPIYSMVQSADGYLWLGTREGVFRFDGVRFEQIPPDPQTGSRTAAQKLLASHDGSIWVAYREGGVSVYRNGALHDMGLKRWPSPQSVVAMAEGKDGSIWIAAFQDSRALARYYNGKWEMFGAEQGLPADPPLSLVAARNGTLWLTTELSVMVRRPRALRFEKVPVSVRGRSAITEDREGRIWLSDSSGSRVIDPVAVNLGAHRFAYPSQSFERARQAIADRVGNHWSADGVTGLRMTRLPNPAGAATRAEAEQAVEQLGRAEGLASDNVTAVLLDHEGSIWAGSLLGLDQFRAPSVVAEPVLTKLGPNGYSILGAQDGTVYVGQAGSVYRVRPSGRPELLLREVPAKGAICEGPDHSIWIALEKRMMRIEGNRRSSLSLPDLGGKIVLGCVVDQRNSVWINVEGKGVFNYDINRWKLIAPIDKFSESSSIVMDDRGRIVFSIEQELIVCADSHRCLRHDLGKALGNDIIKAIYQAHGYLVASSSAGLFRFKNDTVGFVSFDRLPTLRGTVSFVETPQGEIWLIADAGIVRLPVKALDQVFDNPQAKLDSLVLSSRDGLPGVAIRAGFRDAARGGDGRIWFPTSAGVVWVDARRLPTNDLAPNVTIGSLIAGGVTYLDPTKVRLPAGSSSGEIDFAALSFVVPQRNQVRYQLEGSDPGWVDPGMRRQMFFSNLGPGTYRFRVVASNNNGLWNRRGATLEFTIPPTFLQSNWFKVLCALTCAALLWLAYSLRLRQVTGRLRATLEVKLAERERIARELHDTLLQGFQGLILRFQVLADRLPANTPWRDTLYKELDHADAVLIAGRDQVSDVRASVSAGDLAQSLMAAALELKADSPMGFDLTVEGEPRTLHPIVHQEVQRVGEEAMRNAFRHSGAMLVSVVIIFQRRQLRLAICDNGAGLPEDVSTLGTRQGHFGLPGMRERAQTIGGTLTIAGQRGAGTEILLTVPGKAAYASRPRWHGLSQPRTARAET